MRNKENNKNSGRKYIILSLALFCIAALLTLGIMKLNDAEAKDQADTEQRYILNETINDSSDLAAAVIRNMYEQTDSGTGQAIHQLYCTFIHCSKRNKH